MASKSNTSDSPGGQAVHTTARAAAMASGMADSSNTDVASTARQAVAIEATGPNSSAAIRSTAGECPS